MAFKFKNLKDNLVKTQQDPYFAIKFQYRMQRYFVYFILAIIAVTFITMIWNFKTTTSYGWVIRIFMVFIMVYLLYQIYAKTILPTKKILQHYENVPTPISSKFIDVPAEVDSILAKFDKDGNKIKK